jgi:hypothetical protein
MKLRVYNRVVDMSCPYGANLLSREIFSQPASGNLDRQFDADEFRFHARCRDLVKGVL